MQVSKAWQRLANHNSLWEAKCREVKLEVPVSDNPIWKRVFRDNLYLRLNWNSGACRVTDFKGHTLRSEHGSNPLTPTDGAHGSETPRRPLRVLLTDTMNLTPR